MLTPGSGPLQDSIHGLSELPCPRGALGALLSPLPCPGESLCPLHPHPGSREQLPGVPEAALALALKGFTGTGDPESWAHRTVGLPIQSPSVPHSLPLPETPPHPHLLSAPGRSLSLQDGRDAVLRSLPPPPLPEGRAELLEPRREQRLETLGSLSKSGPSEHSWRLMGGLARESSLRPLVLLGPAGH